MCTQDSYRGTKDLYKAGKLATNGDEYIPETAISKSMCYEQPLELVY